MAELEARPSPDQSFGENEEKNLKYLDFVQIAALYVMVCFSSLYGYAKQNSGPLRPGVQTVEGTVKTIIGPVYNKFHHIPFHLLKFVDRKVDDSIVELDHHVPTLLKTVSRHAWAAAQKAPEVVRELATEVRQSGLSHTAKTTYVRYEPTAKELYVKYEPMAEQYAVAMWRALNRLPLFPQFAHIMVPTAAYWAGKYNKAVVFATGKGYALSNYMPLVPIDRIGKTFQGHGIKSESELVVSTNGPYVTISQ